MAKKRPLKKKRKPSSDSSFHKTKVRIIGIGGGGGSIISEISPGVKRVSFIAANTDSRALRQLGKKVKKFHFGQELTKGLGTGMNVEIGEQAAQLEKDKIKSIFEGQDLCIIISSLGGGTGSGATPVFAKIAKKMNCLTLGIFTLPFNFEGEKKMEIAQEALRKIKPHLNAFSVIPNERIFKIIDKNTPLKEALSAINKQLVNNLEGLIEMIYLPGIINIDFADLKAILRGRGRLSYLNIVEIEEGKGEESLKKLSTSPLYPYTIKGAKGILYNVIGDKDLELVEVSQISKTISDLVNRRAKIIFGIGQKSKLRNKVEVALFAVGCSIKEILKEKKKRRKKVKKEPPKEIKKEVKKPKKKKKKPKKQPPKKIRRSALEVKKKAEEDEKEVLEKEEIWETPAILRRGQNSQ